MDDREVELWVRIWTSEQLNASERIRKRRGLKEYKYLKRTITVTDDAAYLMLGMIECIDLGTHAGLTKMADIYRRGMTSDLTLRLYTEKRSADEEARNTLIQELEAGALWESFEL